MRQIRNQLHSFSKMMAAPTKAMPVESEKRNRVKNTSKKYNQCGSEGAKEREAYKVKHFSQLSI